MIKDKEFKFNAAYDRVGIIRFGTITCHVCKKPQVDGIAIDSSDGEYGEGRICLKCIEENGKDKID